MKKLLSFLIGVFMLLSIAAQAATLLPPGKRQFLDRNGAPLANGQVWYYVPGTTTLKNTWQDAGQTTLNTNPVLLDSSGYGTIYGNGTYREIVRDQYGNTIWDSQTSDGLSALSGVIWAGHSTGTGNAQVVSATNFSNTDGQMIFFVATYANTSAMTLNAGTGPIAVRKLSQSGSVGLTGYEVTAGSVTGVVYKASDGVFQLITNFNGDMVKTDTTLTGTGTYASPLAIVNPGWLTTVSHDTTLTGSGTGADPLKVATGLLLQVPTGVTAPKLYAWGFVDGTTGALLAGSGATIAKPATGNYTITTSNTMADANFTITGTANGACGFGEVTGYRTTTVTRVWTWLYLLGVITNVDCSFSFMIWR